MKCHKSESKLETTHKKQTQHALPHSFPLIQEDRPLHSERSLEAADTGRHDISDEFGFGVAIIGGGEYVSFR